MGERPAGWPGQPFEQFGSFCMSVLFFGRCFLCQEKKNEKTRILFMGLKKTLWAIRVDPAPLLPAAAD
jgi:hypothetical protein